MDSASRDDQGRTVTEQVKQQTQVAAQQAQQTAGQLTNQAGQRAASLAQTQKDQVTQSLTSVAQALRQSGQQLGDQGQGMPQQAMDKAADQVEQLAGYLQSRDVNQIVADAEGFARSRPSVFLGGAFALGFLLSRFLKSAPASSRTVDGSPNVMQQGLYRTPDVPSSYEDVRGAPDVRVGYAQGPAGTGYGVPSGPR